jgi:hypothetical protein
MDDHDHKHNKRKWQMSHVPVLKQILHGLQPVDFVVERHFIFHEP